VISTGEKLACILVVAALMAHGISAKLVSLHDVVAAAYGPDPEFQQAELYRLGPRFFHPLATEIAKSIRSCEAGGSAGICVPVVTGYFGSVPKSLITSVGKGYSDFCAALCASGLSATELQIWKEVDGVFTADPRKISSARLLSTLTLEEARELTHYGSQVIHPFTMDQLRHGGIPLRLKNVLRPQGNGTIIVPTPSSSGTCTPAAIDGAQNLTALQVSFLAANSAQDDSLNKGKPTAITSKNSIVLVNIQSNREAKSLRFLTDVFQRLDELHALVDLSTSSEQSVSVALSINNNNELIPIIKSLESCGKVRHCPTVLEFAHSFTG
jgi:aspartate kinase